MTAPRPSVLKEQPWITKELRDARVARGIPQKGLAHRLGVAQSTFSEWERGYRQPSIDRVILWAVALGYSLELTKG